MPRMNQLSSYKTTIAPCNGFTTVTYHTTAIVQWNDKEIILNSGGWRTVTTARKIRQAANQFGLGYGLMIKRGEWSVEYNGQTVPFQDGLILRRA